VDDFSLLTPNGRDRFAHYLCLYVDLYTVTTRDRGQPVLWCFNPFSLSLWPKYLQDKATTQLCWDVVVVKVCPFGLGSEPTGRGNVSTVRRWIRCVGCVAFIACCACRQVIRMRGDADENIWLSWRARSDGQTGVCWQTP
jgi:hypothetical protein